MQTRRKGILFVCEDATMLEVRQILLERFGYKVWPTTSLDDARTIARLSCPDMLLMENSYYPQGDTEHLAENVKKVCPQIIAVVLAPYFAVRDTSHSAVDRFVARDDSPDLLLAQIQELLEPKAKGGSSAANSSAF
jgi:DNA-binding NtrC family response regulator